MVWPLTLRRTVILKKVLHVPTEKVLAVLQNPNVLLAANSVVINVAPDSLEPSNSWYTVTGVISFAGLFSFQAKYRCRLDLVQDGLDMEVFAAAGTRAKGRYRARSIETEVTELKGEVVIESVFFMLPYVSSIFAAAHISGLEISTTRVENRTNMSLVFLSSVA
ncbi:hypothetical protein C0993_007568 [Termitomyces sp. T159_Od127]|nr:hypothetical protein C0993_007568 [Termitomyces sp. T159_Od127]